MPTVEEFVASPSEDVLDLCTKDQLLKIAEHYKIDVGCNVLKERVKAILKSNLFDQEVVIEKPPVTLSSLFISTNGLTFEQRKELFILQTEHDKYKVNAAIERDFAVEKLLQQTEQTRLDFEHQLELIREGKLSAESKLSTHFVSKSDQPEFNFDVLGNL